MTGSVSVRRTPRSADTMRPNSTHTPAPVELATDFLTKLMALASAGGRCWTGKGLPPFDLEADGILVGRTDAAQPQARSPRL